MLSCNLMSTSTQVQHGVFHAFYMEQDGEEHGYEYNRTSPFENPTANNLQSLDRHMHVGSGDECDSETGGHKPCTCHPNGQVYVSHAMFFICEGRFIISPSSVLTVKGQLVPNVNYAG
jgi:hypothetical protein